MGKRLLYFDCFTGIAGDMTCAALLSLSGAERELRKALKGLPLAGYALKVARASSGGIAGLRVDVNVSGKQAHARHLPEIVGLLRKSALPPAAKARAERAFDLLGEAEAAVHGTTKDKVHFHEVGAVDAIVDISAGCVLFDLLGNPEAYCSALPGGSGEAWSEHGKIPVPGPATLALTAGATWRFGEGEGELVTPTGAALLRAFDVSFAKPPEMKMLRVGTGLGHKEFPNRPNCLRVIEGESTGGGPGRDRVLQVEANIDDMNPQRFELLMARAFEAGALDVAILPATMKKGRPGWLLRILCPEENLEIVSAAVFSLSTSIGLRYHACDRLTLSREIATVDTPYGPVRVKAVALPDGTRRGAPEYDDVKKAVKAGKGSFEDVSRAAEDAWRNRR
jgi:uncharacterized protein (TIGR00299 family) protein